MCFKNRLKIKKRNKKVNKPVETSSSWFGDDFETEIKLFYREDANGKAYFEYETYHDGKRVAKGESHE